MYASATNKKVLICHSQGPEYAIKHKHIIEEYGRFPHRNQILGRQNTAEEEEYLTRPDAGF